MYIASTSWQKPEITLYEVLILMDKRHFTGKTLGGEMLCG
jgi:hypothetical protein